MEAHCSLILVLLVFLSLQALDLQQTRKMSEPPLKKKNIPGMDGNRN